MACEICGRPDCTRSFHSFPAQEAYDAEQRAHVSPRTIEVTDRVEVGRGERGYFVVSLEDRWGDMTISREDLEKLRDAITQLLEEDKQ